MRTSRNKSPKKSFIVGRLLIVLAIIIVGAVGAFLFYREGTLPANARDTTSEIFVIEQGEPLNTVIRRLESEKLIRSRLIFYLVIRQLGIEREIEAGTFRLSPSMDAYTLAEELTHGTDDTWITVVEGLRKEEIAEVISDELDIPAVEIETLAEEGYLFPDTYLFPQTASAEGVVTEMRRNFDEKVTQEIIDGAASQGLSLEELVILASLVEREANTDAGRREVASVMLRRIEEGMPLQIDATVQYVVGYDLDEKTWWKNGLTFDDLEIESPYNTYVNTGLPPGPIASPSLSSMIAVSEADPNTPYLFYITGADGEMYYAEDLEGHNANIEQHGLSGIDL